MLRAQEQEKERRNEKIEAVQGFIQKAMDTASPEKSKTEQQELILVCAGLTIFFLLGLPNEFRRLYYAVTTGYFRAADLFIVASLFAIPIMVYLLYKRKKAGWTIAAVYYTITLVLYARSALLFFNFSGMLGRTFPSGYAFMVAAVVTAAILYYINSVRFIRHYPVTTKWQFTTVILAALAALLITSV